MEENQAGITAIVTAYSRAYHATHDTPKIFDDFLADALFTPQEHTFFDQSLSGLLKLIDPALAEKNPDPADALALVMQIQTGSTTLSRSRYCENALEEAIHRGVEQYVILGAGMDTFAFRKPEVLKQLQVFEIDHPVTQAMKRQRIETAGWLIPEQLHWIPLDFTKDDLQGALRNCPAYNSQKQAFFSWLGVSYYLTSAVVLNTLQSIAANTVPGSCIVFDYFDQDALIPQKAAPTAQLTQTIVRQSGEPIKSGFAPQSLAAELQPLGLHLEENLSPQEIDQQYFQNRRDLYHAAAHIHFARCEVK